MSQEPKKATAIEYVLIVGIVVYAIWSNAPSIWGVLSNAQASAIGSYNTFLEDPVIYALALVIGIGFAFIVLKRPKRVQADKAATASSNVQPSSTSVDASGGEREVLLDATSDKAADDVTAGKTGWTPTALEYGILSAIVGASIIAALNALKG